jgi:hypothetical protein
MGLTKEATDFLKENAVIINKSVENPYGTMTIPQPDGEVIAKIGMFDEVELHEYKMKDGTTCREIVQEEIWSGGPVIFLALKHNGAVIGKWKEKEIRQYRY